MPETISVVIPNWNGARWLRPCLNALRKQTYSDFVTYVVDNGSEDESVHLMETEYPEVVIIKLPENVGFADGMNAGIEKAKGKYIAALNNDTETHPEWLEMVVKAMESHPEAGLCASRLMDFEDRNIIDSLGDGFYPFGVSFKVGSGRSYENQPASPVEVQSACAAASIYRRDMIDEIGAFDSDFFAYMEDVDLGLRARGAGYKCIFVPDAVVYHIGSATSGGSSSAFSVRLTTRNTYQVILKNVPLILMPVYLACTFGAQMAGLLLSIVTGKPEPLKKHPAAFFSGLKAATLEAANSLKKRRKLAPSRRESTLDFLSATFESIILDRRI